MASSLCRGWNILVWRCRIHHWVGRQRPHALTRTYTHALNVLTGTIPKHMLNRLGFTQHVPPPASAVCQIAQIKDLRFFCTMTTQLVLQQRSLYSCSGCCLRKAVRRFFGPCICQELLGRCCFPSAAIWTGRCWVLLPVLAMAAQLSLNLKGVLLSVHLFSMWWLQCAFSFWEEILWNKLEIAFPVSMGFVSS